MMRDLNTWARAVLCVSAFALLGGSFVAIPAAAQGSQGQNAVFPASGANCSSGSQCAGSSAFVDASKFLGGTQGRDLCDTLYYLFTHSYPINGEVIDARGIGGSALTCTHGTPWSESGSSVSVPSTIFLPATTAANPIVVSSGWVLPTGTHLIGQGEDISSGTTIQAASNFGDVRMMSFCSSQCAGAVAVENLILDGKGQSINGIVNAYASNLSYVDHVSLYQILGVGLVVTGAPAGAAATGSGPYTNISFNTGSFSGASGTICMQIKGGTGLAGTAGIRGLRCIAQNGDGGAGVLLDSSNNSIKDLSIAGFHDGILVGSVGSAANNVLINVIDDTTVQSCGPPCVVNVVHISSNNS